MIRRLKNLWAWSAYNPLEKSSRVPTTSWFGSLKPNQTAKIVDMDVHFTSDIPILHVDTVE